MTKYALLFASLLFLSQALHAKNYRMSSCNNFYDTERGMGWTLLTWSNEPKYNGPIEEDPVIKRVCNSNCLTFCTPRDSDQVSYKQVSNRNKCRRGKERNCRKLGIKNISPEDICMTIGGRRCYEESELSVYKKFNLNEIRERFKRRNPINDLISLKISCVTGVNEACGILDTLIRGKATKRSVNCKKNSRRCKNEIIDLVEDKDYEEAQSMAIELCNYTLGDTQCLKALNLGKFATAEVIFNGRHRSNKRRWIKKMEKAFKKDCIKKEGPTSCFFAIRFDFGIDNDDAIDILDEGCKKLNPKIAAEYCELLGEVYEDEELNRRAKKAFRRACTLRNKVNGTRENCRSGKRGRGRFSIRRKLPSNPRIPGFRSKRGHSKLECQKNGLNYINDKSKNFVGRINCKSGKLHGESNFGDQSRNKEFKTPFPNCVVPFKRGLVHGSVICAKDPFRNGKFEDGIIVENLLNSINAYFEDGKLHGSARLHPNRLRSKRRKKVRYANGIAQNLKLRELKRGRCRNNAHTVVNEVNNALSAKAYHCGSLKRQKRSFKMPMMSENRFNKGQSTVIQIFSVGRIHAEIECKGSSVTKVSLYDKLKHTLKLEMPMRKNKPNGKVILFEDGKRIGQLKYRRGKARKLVSKYRETISCQK